MKGVLLFVFLASLVICQNPETHEGRHEERVQRRKKIQKKSLTGETTCVILRACLGTMSSPT